MKSLIKFQFSYIITLIWTLSFISCSSSNRFSDKNITSTNNVIFNWVITFKETPSNKMLQTTAANIKEYLFENEKIDTSILKIVWSPNNTSDTAIGIFDGQHLPDPRKIPCPNLTPNLLGVGVSSVKCLPNVKL